MVDDKVSRAAKELLEWAVQTAREINAKQSATLMRTLDPLGSLGAPPPPRPFPEAVTVEDVLAAHSAAWWAAQGQRASDDLKAAREIGDPYREEIEGKLRDAAKARAEWSESQKLRDMSRPPGSTEGD